MIRNTIFLLSVATLFTACVGNNTYVNKDENIYENVEKYSFKNTQKSEPIITPEEYKKMLAEQKLQEDNSKSIDMNQALTDFYKEWKNVKYKFGGNSKKGIDCSAFTQRIFNEKFDIKIPRTTRTQVKVGKEIKKSELQMGDLVFFKTGKHDRHVGVYMGDGSFMHASIKGVKYTKLNKAFYKSKYWTSRRIIEDKALVYLDNKETKDSNTLN